MQTVIRDQPGITRLRAHAHENGSIESWQSTIVQLSSWYTERSVNPCTLNESVSPTFKKCNMPTFLWPILFNGPASTSSDCQGWYGGCYVPPSYRIYINPYALVYDLLPLVHFLYQYLIHEHVIWTQYSQQHPNILILDSCDRSGKLWWGTLMYTNKHSSRCKRVFEFWEKCNLYKPRWRYTMLKVKITHLPINRWMINPAFTQSNSSAPNHSSLVAITTWGDWLAVNVVIFVANQFALARR